MTKKAESQLIKEKTSSSPSLGETILNALPIGVCPTDETGHYRFMNDAYCAIYEYVREETIGQHYNVIMPPATRLNSRTHITNAY